MSDRERLVSADSHVHFTDDWVKARLSKRLAPLWDGWKSAGRVLMASSVVWFATKTTGRSIIFEARERVRQPMTNLENRHCPALTTIVYCPRTGSRRRHGLVFYPTG